VASAPSDRRVLKINRMQFTIPHEYLDGRPVLTVGMVPSVNGRDCRVMSCDDRDAHLWPLVELIALRPADFHRPRGLHDHLDLRRVVTLTQSYDDLNALGGREP
jgi:hypothetical protein